MQAFKIFQTVTATMSKITVDGAGDETVSTSFTVNIDPTFGYKRAHTRDNEEITGLSTVITGDNLVDNWDNSHRRWKLTYQGREYNVNQPVPFYTVGTDDLEHVEVVLT